MFPPEPESRRPSDGPQHERLDELQRRSRELRKRLEHAQDRARRALGAARDRRLVRGAGPPASAAPAAAAGPVVLVVDDEPLVRELLARCLALGPYRVLQAASGEEALALLGITPGVAAVVTDTWMPEGMSGVELIRRIRARWPTLPLLRISGVHESAFYADPPPEDVPFLAKPFSPADLLRAVGALAPAAPPADGSSP
ncbi:MAG TPA: response regulator [Gemmatimonadales bacterium]|nr:response regulator [Gemmatimonadales bacterium]